MAAPTIMLRTLIQAVTGGEEGVTTSRRRCAAPRTAHPNHEAPWRRSRVPESMAVSDGRNFRQRQTGDMNGLFTRIRAWRNWWEEACRFSSSLLLCGAAYAHDSNGKNS